MTRRATIAITVTCSLDVADWVMTMSNMAEVSSAKIQIERVRKMSSHDFVKFASDDERIADSDFVVVRDSVEH